MTTTTDDIMKPFITIGIETKLIEVVWIDDNGTFVCISLNNNEIINNKFNTAESIKQTIIQEIPTLQWNILVFTEYLTYLENKNLKINSNVTEIIDKGNVTTIETEIKIDNEVTMKVIPDVEDGSNPIKKIRLSDS